AAIAVVISNHPGVPALGRAARHGAPTAIIERSAHPSHSAQHQAITDELVRCGVELVVLAGFDRVVGPEILRAFPYRIINIHPSLLPAFGGGLHAQADALGYGVKVAGCTVHFVTEDVDCGPIIAQACVPVLEDDTADTLAARILEQEHHILPMSIRLFAQGRLKVEGRRVRVLPPP
ncbi:MAG: phosphoribosylglycinamide formyltransferase, partial [Bacteroidetes bacterium]|nr:phosphoribosylglycinamide formyltransferase [Bacteroidota bacterium]